MMNFQNYRLGLRDSPKSLPYNKSKHCKREMFLNHESRDADTTRQADISCIMEVNTN